MSISVPAPAAMFCVMFAMFGAIFALGVTLTVGLPAVHLLQRLKKPLMPWLLAIALIAATLLLLGLQCSLASCGLPPMHSVIFAGSTATVTALSFYALQASNMSGKA
jgi:hypothetical protein